MKPTGKEPSIKELMAVAEERDPRTYAIIGAAMEVHQRLGCGFLEPVYHESLAIELAEREMPHQREAAIPLTYKGRALDTSYRADLICYDGVVVEIKALDRLRGREEAQIINYLKGTGHKVGLLLNFGAESLEYKRFVL